jgi:hypothetical protein
MIQDGVCGVCQSLLEDLIQHQKDQGEGDFEVEHHGEIYKIKQFAAAGCTLCGLCLRVASRKGWRNYCPDSSDDRFDNGQQTHQAIDEGASLKSEELGDEDSERSMPNSEEATMWNSYQSITRYSTFIESAYNIHRGYVVRIYGADDEEDSDTDLDEYDPVLFCGILLVINEFQGLEPFI